MLIIAWQVWPAPPRLDVALARIQATRLHPAAEPASAGRSERVGGWLATHLARPAGLLALPRSDLALLDRRGCSGQPEGDRAGTVPATQ
ncbi:hypothetical protein [Actinoallomurus sp. NPDC050550]|uniref:hypothetical protein n=1 Tax=Actinoallomurus sp. NPDC050550 TaxID=3154937 RepID=UPI0033DE0388